MKRNGFVSPLILRTVFLVLAGIAENGERLCDAAASSVLHQHREQQIDETFDIRSLPKQTHSRLYREKSGGAFDTQFPSPPEAVEGGVWGMLKFSDDEMPEARDRQKRWEPSTHDGREIESQDRATSEKYGVVVLVGDGVIELTFYRRLHFGDVEILERVPAKEILEKPGLLEDLQRLQPSLNIHRITPEHGLVLAVYSSPFWMQSYFPYAVAGGSVILVLTISMVTYVCFCRAKDSVDLEANVENLGSQHIYPSQSQHHVLYPAVSPDTGSPVAVQPCSAPIFVPVGHATTPVPAQPVRLKRKGLLERRGSNASLTLDLQPSPELGHWDGTPPKESSALEYLMSAGNRLSRRDLRNAAKNTKILYEEFWEIPMNHPEKVSVAGSGLKNRYKTIIPNEHSRVILPDADQDPLSSYINANYIRGYEGEPKAYIATQGPMAHTIVDFWQMVWHEGCPIVVMITKLKEKNKPKCENYLPEHHGVYGDIEVTIAKVIQKKGYVLRHIHLKHQGESRMLLHFWYTTWPDHKPPDSPSNLLDLVKEVELRRFKPDGITPRGPVIVHCSAGIGRTGCFVAVSIGIRQLREEHSVDILGIVCSMRLDRGGMIQTHEQYDFAHQALCEYERTLGEPSIQSLTALTSE
ncbi:hypothetical protein BaRGS_00027268 [Batillaria attramentaria]|uniref:protein-tyrosine-phosphatase n=1 Tax=Batillaria attramentaria TaxID=370345 RepID=A0ABD0K2I4_9CAEN